VKTTPACVKATILITVPELRDVDFETTERANFTSWIPLLKTGKLNLVAGLRLVMEGQEIYG